MNKKEAAEMERLREQIALRFTEDVPTDVAVPTPGSRLEAVGWYCYGADGARPDCRNLVATYSETRAVGMEPYTGSKGGRPLHSSKSRALKAFRREAELLFAQRLRIIDIVIDAAIAEESGNPCPQK